MIYWDTSCVLKLYARESDSAQVLRCTGIATADVRMRAAADALALPVSSP